MSNCFAATHGIVVNMAAVVPSVYEAFRGGMEVDAMDMDDKVKGADLRGKNYTVSQDGLCPRCGNSNRLYVILDKLFPMGDMPEILHTLIAKGRAILWSSQEKEGYRDPPTFLCRGFCPPDPLGAGFNVNWNNVSLNQILESLDRPVQAIKPVSSPDGRHFQDEGSTQGDSSDNTLHVLDEFRGERSDDERNASQTSAMQSLSDKEEATEEDDEDDEESDEDDDDDDDDNDEIDEEELIKQMLAKEQQKLSQQNSNEDEDDEEDNDDDDNDSNEQQEASSAVSDSDNFSQPSASSSNVISSSTVTVTASSSTVSNKASSTEANSYPVSSTGRCPYCGSSDVKYIIMVSENTKDTDLPQGLQQLLKGNHAFKMAIGDSQPPSFQCQKCQYGFNLNWSTTSLDRIFGMAAITSSSTTAATTSASHKTTYQTPASYKSPAGYPSYTPPVGLLPPRYPPPVGIPPPVSYHGYAPTYPGYYGSYYPPPIPPPAGSYPPFPPAVPPPRIPPPGIPPPGILPPGITPPGIPPPGIPPPGLPPPGIPPPGLPPPGIPPPPSIPPPGIPPPGYPPPAVPPVPRPSGGSWGSYPYTNPTYYTPPRYPPPPSPGYVPPPAVRPYRPPQIRVRPPKPWYQPPVTVATSAASVPTQPNSSTEQEVADDNCKVAAARFEMVLNQIDQAKARVRHEKDLMKEFQKEVLNTTATDSVTDNQQSAMEPNALTDEGQQMAEYDEKPPGEEDTEFDSNVIITESLKQDQYADASMNIPPAEQSTVTSQLTPTDSENPEIVGHENDEDASHLVESGDAEHNSTKDLDDDDADNDLPETIEGVAKETVPIEAGRSGLSKKKGLLGVQAAPSSTRQTRRSRRSEPVISTEDTDSTAAEEETPAVTGRARRSRKTKPPSRRVERLDIRDVQDKEVPGGVEVIDIDMAESSDMLSQSSAVPETESDSQEVPSESLASSSEAETAPAATSIVAGPRRGRTTRGRKRKQESIEKDEVVSGPPARKTRRGAAKGSMSEEQPSEDSEKAVDEKMSLETPVVINQEEDTEVVTASPEIGSSRRTPMDAAENTNLDQSVEETAIDTEGPVKPGTETRTSRRQTRKSAQKSQEPDEAVAARQSTTIHPAEESTGAVEDAEAMEVEKTTSNRRTRRSAPRSDSQGTDKPATKRQTRASLQVNSQDSHMADAEHFVNKDEAPESDTPGDENKLADNQPSVEQKNIISDTTSQEDEGKTTRRTRASRKSSASSEDASVNTRLDVHLSTESDTLTTEDVASSFQTRSRKSPALQKVETPKSDTSADEEAEKTPKTRKSRKSLNVKEDTTTEEVQLSTEPVTPEGSVSSRRTRRNKSAPSAQEATVLSQESADNLVGEEDIEEEESTAPSKRVSRKTATPVESTETVTKRVTRSRQKK